MRYHRLGAPLGVPHRPTLFTLEAAEGFSPRSHDDWTEVFTGHQLAVIDSLSSILSLAGLDENSPTDTKAIMTAIRAASERAECAPILITHSGHDIEDKSKAYQRKRPRGSPAIIQGAGSIWTFTGTDERGSIRRAWLTRESEQDDGSELTSRWGYRIVTSDACADEVDGIVGLDIQRVANDAETPESAAEIPADMSDAIVWALSTAPDGLSMTALSGKIKRNKSLIEKAIVSLGSTVRTTSLVVQGQERSVYTLASGTERPGD